MTERTTEPTAEERRWLSDNWSIDEPAFRQWIAGSDRAHKLVRCLLANYTTLDTQNRTLRKAQQVWREAVYPCQAKTCACIDGYHIRRITSEMVALLGEARDDCEHSWSGLPKGDVAWAEHDFVCSKCGTERDKEELERLREALRGEHDGLNGEFGECTKPCAVCTLLAEAQDA